MISLATTKSREHHCAAIPPPGPYLILDFPCPLPHISKSLSLQVKKSLLGHQSSYTRITSLLLLFLPLLTSSSLAVCKFYMLIFDFWKFYKRGLLRFCKIVDLYMHESCTNAVLNENTWEQNRNLKDFVRNLWMYVSMYISIVPSIPIHRYILDPWKY